MKAFWQIKRMRGMAFALAALILITALPAMAADYPAAPDERDLTVRVLLSRLGVTDRIDLALTCPYLMTLANGTELRFEGGSQLAVMLRDGGLVAHCGGVSLLAGESLTLTRSGDVSGKDEGFRRANFPALYAGDLTLTVADDIIRPVLSIGVEEYLLGVVPYEMNNAFPPEALKAQAVAARTYALYKQKPSAPYDVVDTTNDQAYRGYVTGNDIVERAIADTQGLCGFYGGSLALCYYAASNGGQTERTQTVWQSGESLPYYAFGADKYDVENPASTVKSIELRKRYKQDEVAPYGIRKLVASQLADRLTSLGYDPAPESVRVDAVLAASVGAPKGESGSKLMTALHLELKISGRTRVGGATVAPEPSEAASGDEDDEEVSLFFIDLSDATPTPAPDMGQEQAPVYGAFTALEGTVVIDADIFPTAEKAFAMNISSNYDNELWSVRETDAAFVVEARRYGHGVGMSQRGAQWMAERYDMKFDAILAFYYPGMELCRYDQSVQLRMRDNAALSEKAGPAPSPTPRPTLMPATMEAGEGQWFAEVSGIDDDSTLNLRAEPDMGGDILMRLYKYQKLLVVERCPEDGWVKVRSDAIEGYVVEKYLKKLE